MTGSAKHHHTSRSIVPGRWRRWILLIERPVNDPSLIAPTPQPRSLDAALFNNAHHQRPFSGIDRSLFRSPARFIFS